MNNLKEQRDTLRHSLGLKNEDDQDMYRNRYAAEPDDETCNELCAKGMMHQGAKIPGGLQYFHVTNFGQVMAMKTQEWWYA
ncbi:MAG: hypothetical protein JRJ45_00425 [Deltaproteobacteria bacterium]|nr:hypothetical protein [Deltaproteobacteria bacterium]